jgi:hypothetical protein
MRRNIEGAMRDRFIASIVGGSGAWNSPFECPRVTAAVDSAYRSLAADASESVTMRGAGELAVRPTSGSAAADAPLAATAD